MPLNHPSSDQLLAAIQAYLQHPLPDVNADRYLRKVAQHCVGIVRRELAQGDALVAFERSSLQAFLGSNEQDTRLLSQQLCDQIDAGELVLSDALLTTLRDITALKLRIDHPGWDQ